MASLRLSLLLRFTKPMGLWKQNGPGYLDLNPFATNGFERYITMSASFSNKKGDPGTAAAEDDDRHELRFGKIFDKKPVRVILEEGKLYSWCTCGLSKKQPFCDNSHRAFNEADRDKSLPPFKSHKFQVDERKQYTLCNCKQTRNRPFCDGTHKQKFVQDSALS